MPFLAVGLALLLTLLLRSLLYPTLLPFFYAAVAISAWSGGMRAGLSAICLSVLAIQVFLLAPIEALPTALSSVAQLGAFVLVTGLISFLGSELRTKRRIEILYQQVQEQFDVLNRILAASTDHIYVFDRLGRYSYVSQGGAQVLGFQPDEIVGKTWRELGLPAKLMERVDAQREQVMQTGQPLKEETNFATPDGIRYYEYIFTPLQTSESTVEAVVGVSRDITERKQAEAALRESQALFQNFMQHSPATAYIKDEAGRYLYVNPLIEQTFGRLLNEWVGKTDFDLFPAEVAQQWRQNDLQVLTEGKTLQVTEIAPHENGDRYYLSFKFPLQNAAGQQLMAGMSIDVTEQKRAEQALAESEYRYAQILNSVQDMVFCKAPGSVVVYANKAACDYYEMTVEELRGITDVPFNELDFTQQYLQDDLKVFTTGEPIEVLEEPNRRADGEIHYFHTIKTPVFDTQGNVTELVGVSRDITERIRAEAALRESEARFRAVFESNMMGILFWSADGLFTDANDAFLQMVGYTRDDLARGAVRWDKMTPSEYRSLDEHALAEILDRGVCVPYEKEYLCQDGSRLPVLIGGALLQGFTDRGVCFVLDITDRKQKEIERAQLLEREQKARAEAELQRSYLYALLMQAPAHICIQRGADHVFEFANPLYSQLVDGRELMGHPVREAFPDLERQGFFELLDQVLETGEPFIGKEVAAEWDRLGNGTLEEGFFNFVYQPMQGIDGKPEGIMTFAFEVTDQVLARRQAETLAENLQIQQQALRESEARFRHLADTAPVLIWMSGTDKLCTYFNKPWLDFTGRTIEQELGNGWAEGVHRDDFRYCLEIYTGSFDARREFKMEYRLRRFDGEYRWVLDHGVPRFTPDGEFLGYIGSCIDIHDRKQAEEQIRRLNEELEYRVKKRTQQLQAMNKELEAFSYSVSHDLRAPLRHINGFVDLLQRRIGTSTALDETSQRYLRTITDTTKEAGRMVDDLLAFSRMGRTEMRLTTLDLNQLLQEVRREMEQDLEDRIIDWHVESLPVVQADPSMMRLVLRNLLENAVKYTRTRTEAIIQIRSTRTENETIVSVHDNGVGFDMQYVHKLFGVFQRLHTNEQFEGTGIGLANVQRIIHRHGGKVWAEGELDRGAAFYFSLPNTPTKEATWN
ncbi:PAS domain S-box protein [Leptolyngbya sp. DQ-M1]|uniref:PAS domain S-box protein n=1 Tax=Leptolyngbya sp. DQ-M1 TaxID=2933920 RepID=UPI003299F0F5